MVDIEKIQDYHSLGKTVKFTVGEHVVEGVLTDVSVEYTGEVDSQTHRPIGTATVSIQTESHGKFTGVDGDRVILC